ncbi:hypothetical protein AB0D34_08680 [Streptomyces sp. NPDC048420]|uniref:hypothetical protein n=1 Tax=Streptomyces sp. NPDC048420 TaxID=3155755 RepID=UPI00344033C1
MNAGLPDGSHPIEATTLTDSAEVQVLSRGHGYESEMPVNTPAEEVANAVLATLPAQKKPSALVSCPLYDKAGVSAQRRPRLRHAVVPAAISATSPPYVRESAVHLP